MGDMTIKQFCQRHGISASKYNSLRKRGLGPRELVLGARSIRITEAEDAAWEARMRETEAQAVLKRERARQLELARIAAKRSMLTGNHVNEQRRKRGGGHE
jgi:hypothetical protein